MGERGGIVLQKLRLTLGAKLIGIIAFLLGSSLGTLVFLATRAFTDNNQALIELTNVNTVSYLSQQAQEYLVQYSERIRLLALVMKNTSLSVEMKESLVREFYSKDKDIYAVVLVKMSETDAAPEIFEKAPSPTLTETVTNQIFQSIVTDPSPEMKTSLQRVAKGEPLLAPAEAASISGALLLGLPFLKTPDGFQIIVLAFLKPDPLIHMVSQSDATINFLVDEDGRLIAHPDRSRVLSHESVRDIPVVQELLKTTSQLPKTFSYLHPIEQERFLASYRKIGFGGVGAVAELQESIAFAPVQALLKRSSLIAVIVLSIAFLIGYFFSGTLTRPIKLLVGFSKEISKGNFQIRMKPKGRDEIATLTQSFNEMAEGLEERDRVKDIFNKFHNKEVADQLLSGKVSLGGERKQAVVFFSDIRGFTDMSEKMSPEEVVEMLNEYMTEMVRMIQGRDGVVDKYVGDAIMALWGTPIAHPNDPERALRACLDMRLALKELNDRRLARGQTPLKIGMGVNLGPVIAGNIGSEERMEYTVIGDTVNTAARIEAMTKAHGTDLLVSDALYQKLQDKFIFEKAKETRVKGKTDALVVFKVNGYIGENGEEIVIETPYSRYKAEADAKVYMDEAESPEPKEITPPPFRFKKGA